MSRSRFLHAADVHLDSPLDKIRRLNEQTFERLQRASRRSLELVVQIALERDVAAVVIAGDLFDGPVKDAGAGLWVDSQLRKLASAGIAVLLIRGNHDALSNAHRIVQWSRGITEFGSKRASTVQLDNCGLAFHGQSFGARAESADLAERYPHPIDGYFNVGLLHTSLAGDSRHDTYAPTSIESLEGKGYDYWALGHIHARSPESLSDRCYIGYSGNTQGRRINEPGPKGCQLIEVEDGQVAGIEFIPTDSLRWYRVDVDLSKADSPHAIESCLEEQAGRVIDQAEDRLLAVRVQLTGTTEIHSYLTRPGVVDTLVESLGQRLSEMGNVWLEAVKVATHPMTHGIPADLDVPLGYVKQIADEFRQPGLPREELLASLEELLKKSRRELSGSDWGLLSQDEHVHERELQRLIDQAEDLLLARLSSHGQ